MNATPRQMVVATSVTRPVFEGMGPISKLVFYGVVLASMLVLAWGVWRRIGKYRRGRPAGRRPINRPSSGARLRVIMNGSTISKGHRKIGVAHQLIFWGLTVALAATVILTIDSDIVRNVSRAIVGHPDSFFHGTFFELYTLVVDTTGFGFLLGVLYMAVRRVRTSPSRNGYQRVDVAKGTYSRRAMIEGDWVFLALLILILVTAYLLTGLRILGQSMASFTWFSPFARCVAEILSALGMTSEQAVSVHGVVWWVHATLALGFIAYLPFSKAMHVVVDAVNLMATDASSSRTLPAPPPGRAGYREIADFTWKELLDLDACTKCGRCHDVCPARAAGAPLSPRDMILDLRQFVDTSVGGITVLDRERRAERTGPRAQGPALKIAGDVIDQASLWACTTCMHCVQVCPVGVEHLTTMVQLRRELVDEGTVDPSLRRTLENLATQGNSYGKSARSRARWTRELDFSIPDARTQPVRYLWFVGDFASFDERLQATSRTLARILHEAGVDFGLLYEGERNAGNDVRRVGEEGLFEMLAAHNVESLAGAQFQEIFTTDPHTLNALRNEYPALGASYEVSHYTQLLSRLIDDGEIRVRALGHRVTYHDPCYLARHNGVVESPRRLLRSLGCELVEMPRHGVDTFCCGAGGGRIWMDDSSYSERPSEMRIAEALTLDVGQFIVSCPKDAVMFSDALKALHAGDRLAVRDIAELVEEAMLVSSSSGSTA